MADDQRVEMVREGSRMGLWLGDVKLAVVDPGLPAQQLARYIEMQLRAGYAPEAIGAMLRGESKATTGAKAPVRKKAPPGKASPEKAPKAPAADLADVLDGTVGAVKKKLATGDYDDQLEALAELESSGKGRKGVLKALAARGEE